tara:strand:- start:600 stop:2531 length:1932 start_codon:yes stop_codon:yes gene_type:complete
MAIVKELELKVLTKGAVKEVNELNSSIKDTGKDAKTTQESLNTISGGAVGRFSALKGKITGVIKSFKSLRVAVIASGIGALLVAVVALQQAFTRSEAGQNKFAKLMGVIGSVVNNLLDLLADFGENIISVFENPKQAIKDFANLIKENIVNRFEGLMELIPALGKAVSLLFKGEFKEAGKVAANATSKVVLGVDNIVEKTQDAINKTKDFVKELEEEGKIAAKIADDRAKADKIERENTVARAKADREIADLRFKAEQRDKFSATERIKFLEEASALEEEITNQEIEAARLRFEAKKTENELSKSTKEDLDEQAQLEAQLIGLNTSKLRLQKRLQTSLTTFRNEEKAERESARKAEEDAQKAELKRIEEKEKAEQIARNKKKLADEKAQQEELKKQEQQWNMLQKLQNTAQEQELLELQQQFDAKMLLAEGNNELELALTDKFFKDSEAIEQKYNQQRVDENKKTNNEIAKNEQRLQDLKTDAVLTGLNTISSLTQTFAGESEEQQKRAFNINKAVGIASTLVQTFQSAQGAYLSQLSIPSPDAPIRAKIAASIATATGLANVAAIAAQKFKSPSKQKPSEEGGGGGLTSPTQAPSFNVVGQSGFNQVAGALGQQQPVQAFVVAGDVTTAQELNNNTIQQATF